MASNQNDPARPGNEFFTGNKFYKALDAYSTAIDQNPEMAKLYSNRAQTYLKLEHPFDALKDVDIGLKLEPDNEKLIYRKCKALLVLRRFADAAQYLDESIGRLKHLTMNEAFKAMIDHVNRLKSEFVNGRYDLPAMIVDLHRLIPKHGDGRYDIPTLIKESKTSSGLPKHADYIAWHKFEIREIAGKGRGLVAKEKIELGELLIVQEAIMFVTFETEMSEDYLERMAFHVSNILSHRPDLAKKFFHLYAGPQLGHLENWTEGEPMDEDRIVGVIRHNYFEDRQVLFKGTIGAYGDHIGLCFVPSYINHTCVDHNCARYFVGNFTFVRATKSIEEGEELVFPYVCPSDSFEDRQRRLQGFVCHCRLCEIERHYSIDVKKLVNEIRQFLTDINKRVRATNTPDPSDVQRLERIVEELQQLRPGLSLDYLAVIVRGDLVASVLDTDPKASIAILKKLIDDLKSAGDFFQALEFMKTYIIAAVYSESEDEQDECEELARGMAKMFYGDERLVDCSRQRVTKGMRGKWVK